MKKLLLILICAPLLLLYNSCSKGGDVPTPNNTPTLQSIIVDQIWELKTEEYRFILNKNGYMYEKSAVCAEFDLKGSWTLEDNDLIITYQQGSLEISEISQITSFTENEIKFNVFTDSTTIIEEVYISVEAVIRGCTDADSSSNYNSYAVCDDGSCIPCIYGCMDSVALNYDAVATCNDNSCTYPPGCTDSTAFNYDPNAVTDDGSCCYISGCTDPSSFNYNSNACYDDGSCVSFLDFTYVPDDNFEQSLIDLGYDNVLDDYVITDNIITVTNLQVFGKGISDLTGIEDFTALTNLTCFNNQLTSLDVSNNTALTYLSCNDNNLTSLDVSNNTALWLLNCSNNQITSLDVSNNTALSRLFVDYNQLTSLDVSNNTALARFGCTNNQIISLDVSNNTSLSLLNCFNNQLISLDLNTSGNTLSLSLDLRCDGNQLTTLNITNINWYYHPVTNSYRFSITNNPNLTCINVDDPAWSTANLTDIDPQHYFSLTCP